MPINYLPSKIAKRMVLKLRTKKVVTQQLTINKAAVRMASESGVLSEKKIEEVALSVIKQYKKKYRKEIKEGASKTKALDETLNDKKLLVSRVQNETMREITKQVKRVYKGTRYVWLPSSAREPDPLHQLKYGKVYRIGVGEMPQDRYGCQCGMRILTEDEELFLDEEIGL